jgi:hypothetical protein
MEDMIFFYFTASVISFLNFTRKCFYKLGASWKSYFVKKYIKLSNLQGNSKQKLGH